MIISHSLRFIFISNPKTGTTSIEAALEQYQDEPLLNEVSKTGYYTRRHMPAHDLRQTIDHSAWNEYFKFSFVRNPWDWFVSSHFYNRGKAGKICRVDRPFTEDEIMESHHFLRSYRGVEWEDFTSQHAYICDRQGQVLTDFLGHFESLQEDFEKVQSVIGCDVELPHVNSSIHHYYKEYYNCETRELLHRLYRRDIDIFGYEF